MTRESSDKEICRERWRAKLRSAMRDCSWFPWSAGCSIGQNSGGAAVENRRWQMSVKSFEFRPLRAGHGGCILDARRPRASIWRPIFEAARVRSLDLKTLMKKNNNEILWIGMAAVAGTFRLRVFYATHP